MPVLGFRPADFKPIIFHTLSPSLQSNFHHLYQDRTTPGRPRTSLRKGVPSSIYYRDHIYNDHEQLWTRYFGHHSRHESLQQTTHDGMVEGERPTDNIVEWAGVATSQSRSVSESYEVT